MVYFTHKPDKAIETYLCEGEWDAIRLGWEMEMRNCEEIAVACFTCGAGNVPPEDQLSRLPGKVKILYDLDESGAKGAAKVQDRMKDRAFIATVPHLTDAPAGWDISDALTCGFTVPDISEAANNAKPWTAPQKPNELRSRLLTNDELLERAQDFVEWLVPDVLTPDELFILGMPPRGGKSLFGLTLAKAVATGGTFLDRPVTQGSVIYINLEDSETKIKQRQIAQGWGENVPVYWLNKFKLSELDKLAELSEDLPDLRLIVMDTFSRVRDDGAKESSAELGQILEPLQEFAKERGVCVLLMHHTGKASNMEGHGADPFDMLRGSTSIRATCRGAIVIVPAEQSYRLLAENGYSDRLDVSVRIHPETLEWKLLGNWTPRVDGGMKDQIVDHLALVGESTTAEISKALNFNATSVSTIMSRLHRDGVVSKRGGGGCRPAVYTRSSNLLKQLEAQFKHPNPIASGSVAIAQTNNLCKDSPDKVDNQPKSGQPTVHISKMSPTHTKVFEQSGKPTATGDSSSNSDIECLSKFRQPDTQTYVFTEGGQVYYEGDTASLDRVCGRKKLTIVAIGEESCEVSHKNWVVTQTIPKTDLRPV
ncbi:AAA family ATPase [filamentous cyanobacterium LEGE 11480]|uniref:AAA family ATPase n=1 Tax=Romeriopsis navalis LEGE 11480 TaxID=2777977 RepID=A0A928VPZ2_9CYAN|nr:AAA family ATPase [Romeriopsis navalis]MBE9031617.1 AAA family ATPase [Romeriopsis navalis LEGE 11480]